MVRRIIDGTVVSLECALRHIRRYVDQVLSAAAVWIPITMVMCVMLGVMWAYTDLVRELRIALDWAIPLMLLLALVCVRRYLVVSACVLGLASLFLAAAYTSAHLNEKRDRMPSKSDLDRTYLIEGRLIFEGRTVHGRSLRIDRVVFLSPDKVAFDIDRLTLYLPPTIGVFPKKSTVRAWVRLKKATPTEPIPNAIRAYRNQWAPAYFGSVKDLRLVETPLPDHHFVPGLNQANRELLSFFLLGNPSQVWRERLAPFGLGHLLAISGLHCLIVFLGLQLMLIPVRRAVIRHGLTLIGLLGFASWVGWTQSVQRAVFMLCIWQLLGLWNRPKNWFRIWIFLLLSVLFLEPRALLFRGYWLTFGASLGLVVGHRAFTWTPLHHPWQRLLIPFLPILGAQLMVIPINLMFDGSSQPMSILWNLIGLVFLVLLILLFIICLPAFLHPFFALPANELERVLERILGWGADWSLFNSVVRFPHHPVVVLFLVLGLALALRCGRLGWRWCMAVCLLFAFLVTHRPYSGPRAVLIDVGQGQCFFCCDQQGNGIVVDAGGRLPPGITCDVLTRLFGGRHLRGVFISHLNQDHYCLVPELPGSVPTYVPKTQLTDFQDSPTFEDRSLIPVERGDLIDLGNLVVRVMWPPPEPVHSSINESGLVLHIAHGSSGIWIPGDTGVSVEESMQTIPVMDRRVLIAGHHGSRTATGARFIDRFRPDHVLISCGRNNRFGHPHRETLDRLSHAGIPVWTTSQGGTIEISTPNRFQPRYLATN